MRKHIIIILLLFAIGTSAQHRVGLSFAPSMTFQFDTLFNTHSLPGAGIELGVRYQYQYDWLLLQTGLDFSYSALRQSVDNAWITDNELVRNRVDAMQMLQFAIPAMIGIKTQHVYALAGVKAIFSPNVSTRQRATIAGEMNNDQFYDDTNQLLGKQQAISSRGSMIIPANMRICLEVGKQFRLWKYRYEFPPILQLGAFTEYDVPGVHLSQYTLLSNTGNQTFMVDLDHIYAPTAGQKKTICHNLYVGVRATLLFDVSSGACRCTNY